MVPKQRQQQWEQQQHHGEGQACDTRCDGHLFNSRSGEDAVSLAWTGDVGNMSRLLTSCRDGLHGCSPPDVPAFFFLSVRASSGAI